MGKSSLVTSSTSNNVQFYSTAGTMGNYNSSSSRLCQGPRRVICFCLLAVITPSLFISTVLLMRFVFNGTATYHINPSDMRILDHKISTMWCQSETIKMNTTFTAYLADGEPRLTKSPAPLTTTKTLIIPDDHKEYWGFYLLKGSTFRIRTCARFKGATLLIVKGRSHLQHCAYIGQADSAGDSDEFSNSGSLESPLDDGKGRNKGNLASPNSVFKPGRTPSSGSSVEEISAIFSKIREYIRNRPKGYSKLKENLAEWLLLHPSGENMSNSTKAELTHLLNSTMNQVAEETLTTSTSTTPHHKIRHENSRHLHPRSDSETNNNPNQNSTIINNHNNNSKGNESNSKEEEMLSKLRREKRSSGVDSRLHSRSLREPEHGTIRRSRRNVDVRKNTDSGEDGAFEDSSEDENDLAEFSNLLGLPFQNRSVELNESTISKANSSLYGNLTDDITIETTGKGYHINSKPDTPNSIWKKEHSHHIGTLNDTNSRQEFDGSDSESESSFSSSEEALAKCEGVVASLYLQPTEFCGQEDYENEEGIPLFYENTVNLSGYYYFIFGSENEKRDNFIRARFELEKYVYELPPPIGHCQDVQECQVNLTFFSNQKMVVQIPQPSPEQEFIWNEVYLAESQCEPRVLLYLIFVVIVPVSIILCSFQ